MTDTLDGIADTACSITRRTIIAQMMSGLVVLTTIHAQDFADTEGDRLQARRTLPIVFPIASRVSMVTGLPLWSFIFCSYWCPQAAYAVLLMGLGGILAFRYFVFRSIPSDRISYLLYNVRACLYGA